MKWWKKASTLAETVVAVYFLAMGFVVAFRLFSYALRFSTRTEVYALAARLAQRRLEEIKSWNQSQHLPAGTLPFSDWSTVDGTANDKTYPESAEMTVHTDVRVPGSAGPPATPDMLSPCTLFEAAYKTANPLAQPKRLNGSYRRLIISVNKSGQTISQLYALVGEPQILGNPAGWLPNFHVQVSQVSGTTSLPPNSSSRFKAELVGPGGKVIPDVVFSWLVGGSVPTLSSDGNGDLQYPRDGSYCDISNRIQVTSTATTFSPGPCYLWAYTIFQGQRMYGASSQLDML